MSARLIHEWLSEFAGSAAAVFSLAIFIHAGPLTTPVQAEERAAPAIPNVRLLQLRQGAPAVMLDNDQQFELTEAMFLEQMFGRNVTLEMERARLEDLLKREIQAIDRSFSLAAEEKRKLLLAGRGDIYDALERVAELERSCTGRQLTLGEYQAFVHRQIQGLHNEIRSSDFFATGLFPKVLCRLRQSESSEEVTPEEVNYRAERIQQVLAIWERTLLVKLDPQQSGKFAELMAASVSRDLLAGAYPHYRLLLEVGRRADEARPFFTEGERARLQQHLVVAKEFEVQFLPTPRARIVAKPVGYSTGPDGRIPEKP